MSSSQTSGKAWRARGGRNDSATAGSFTITYHSTSTANKIYGKWASKRPPRSTVTPDTGTLGMTSTWRVAKNTGPAGKWSAVKAAKNSSELQDVQKYYLLVKKYEKQNELNSKDMFIEWKKGNLKGPLYTKWVNAYIRVWRAID